MQDPFTIIVVLAPDMTVWRVGVRGDAQSEAGAKAIFLDCYKKNWATLSKEGKIIFSNIYQFLYNLRDQCAVVFTVYPLYIAERILDVSV